MMIGRRLENAVVSVLALAWLARGAWRVARGGTPWRAAR
jgi:hypothetical protein